MAVRSQVHLIRGKMCLLHTLLHQGALISAQSRKMDEISVSKSDFSIQFGLLELKRFCLDDGAKYLLLCLIHKGGSGSRVFYYPRTSSLQMLQVLLFAHGQFSLIAQKNNQASCGPLHRVCHVFHGHQFFLKAWAEKVGVGIMHLVVICSHKRPQQDRETAHQSRHY